MNKSALIACFSAALCLGGSNQLFAAGDQAGDQNQVVVQNEQGGDKGLLMFFEEKDLITATKRATSLRKAPAIATIISAEEIRNMGARNLLDVLKMVPGFGISTNEIGLTMVEVRGIRSFLSEKILMMVDGHSLNRNITGSAIFNYAEMMPVENIRQIEIIRGPGSALYGNSAFVATINVLTRNAEEINGLELKAAGGSFDTWQGSLVGGKAIGEKLTLSGSVNQYQSNGQKLTVAADALSGAPFSRAPGNPGLEARQSDVFVKVGYGDLSFRGGYTKTRKDSFIGFAYALVDDNYTEHESYWGELALAHAVSSGLAVNLKLRFDHFDQNPNVKIFPNGFTPAPGVVWPNGMVGKPFVKDRTIGGELQVDWDAFKGNHLISGVSFDTTRQYDVRQQANFDPTTGAPLATVQDVANWNKDVTRDIWALYLQDEWQLAEQVNLTVGVRYDHYSDFGDTVNPRIGLVWSFLDNANIKLLYGQAFRAPNFQELYNINNPALLGNPGLKPEKIKTYEAGVGYRLSRYFAADVNYFYSIIDNQIDAYTPITIDPVTNVVTTSTPIYANIRKTTTQGVELGFNGVITNEFSWKATYAYQNPRDDKTGERLPYVPSQRASANLNYAPVKYVNLHTDLLWTGSRPRAAGDSRADLPDYTTVDLAVTFKNIIPSLEIQATVHNIFDRRFSDPDTSGAAKLIPGDFPREGISGFMTAMYRF